MPYRLNDTNVNEGMHQAAHQVCDNGGKVFLVIPRDEFDELELPLMVTTVCTNCNGTGKLYLSVFVGKPVLAGADARKHSVFHEGMYYEQDLKEFYCPDCNGSGLFGRQAARPAPVQL